MCLALSIHTGGTGLLTDRRWRYAMISSVFPSCIIYAEHSDSTESDVFFRIWKFFTYKTAVTILILHVYLKRYRVQNLGVQTLLWRIFIGDMFVDQFCQYEEQLVLLVDEELRQHFLYVEERIVILIDQKLNYLFDKIEFLIASKSCWMSPTIKTRIRR